MKHALIVAIGAIGCVTIMAGGVRLNVRYNHVQPYFPKGMMVTKLAGAVAGILICVWVAVLSWFGEIGHPCNELGQWQPDSVIGGGPCRWRPFRIF